MLDSGSIIGLVMLMPVAASADSEDNGITITADFECGGAKRIKQIGENHWRMEANGDPTRYNKYFCVRINSGQNTPKTTIRLDIHPDSDVNWEEFFM